MVNRTKTETAVFCYLRTSSSPRCFRSKMARCFVCFYFFLVYTKSTIFYLLHDDVIKSSAINRHLTFYLEFARHHRCCMALRARLPLTVRLPPPIRPALSSTVAASRRSVCQLLTRQIIIWSNSRGGVTEQLTRNYVITIVEVVSSWHFIALFLTLADHCIWETSNQCINAQALNSTGRQQETSRFYFLCSLS